MPRIGFAATMVVPAVVFAGALSGTSAEVGPYSTITDQVAAVEESAQVAADSHPEPFPETGFEVDRVGWVGRVPDQGVVTVRNHFGDVRARFGGYQGEVEVLAVIQQFAAEGARLALETVESEAGVELTVGLRAEGGELLIEREPGQRKRADLVVFVPRGVRLVAFTDQGLLEARGLQGSVTGATRGGEVRVRGVEGAVELSTVSGPVLLALGPRDLGVAQSVVSESGDLTVYLSEEANLTVRVATNQPLGTDFSAELDHQPGRVPAATLATVVLGKGSDRLRLESPGGQVRLLQRPSADRARVRPAW